MTHMRVLVTGATGYVAGQFLPEFRQRYDLRLVDVGTKDRSGHEVDGVATVDLLAADGDDFADLFTGVDVVVHAAYLRPPTQDPPTLYAVERRNVDLAQRVYQAAFDHGVRRVVAVSSNQASRWYEQPWQQGRRDRVGPEEYPRPDRFYGWSKAAYESLGFLYACGSLGRQLEVVCVRIVAPREIEPAAFADRSRRAYARDIAGYLSERDLRQLFRRCVEVEDVTDEEGVPFQIFYGVSNNARTFWSLSNARKVLGYAPEDDSEQRFADDIARLLHGAKHH